MFTLFLRTVILYLLVFATLRLTGKRQVSDLQPFDLVMTLLLAELVSDPISDNSIPLLHGVVPICALFLLQWLLTFVSMKSERARQVLCGSPLVVIEKGKIQEQVMREARYTLNDLLEELRDKNVFDISDVEYAILETNGRINVLLHEQQQQPTRKDLALPAGTDVPAAVVITDGRVHDRVLKELDRSPKWLQSQLTKKGIQSPKEVFFASINGEGELFVQEKWVKGGDSHRILLGGKKHG